MAGNRDLEFTLRFKNEAKTVLNAIQADLNKLGQSMSKISGQMKQVSAAGVNLSSSFNKQQVSSAQAELSAQKLALAQQRLSLESQKLLLAQTKLNQSQDKLNLSAQKLEIEQGRLATIQGRANLESEKLALAQQRLATAKGKVSTAARGLSLNIAGLAAQFLPLTAAAAAFGSVRLADDMILLKARVENATQSTEEFNKSFSGLVNISRQTGTSLETTVNIFQRLSFVRKEIKATADEMLGFTDTVSKLGVISGASPDALKFGLTQLGQSLSSNIVRAEEFNSIMENIPAVGNEIAKQFGITSGQLRLLVVNGQVLSEDVFAALLNASKGVNEQFSKFPLTVGRAFQGLLIDIQEAIAGINNTTGASQGLIVVITKLGSAFKFLGDEIRLIFSLFKISFDGISTAIASLQINTLNAAEKIGNGIIDVINKFKKVKIDRIDLGLPTPQEVEAEGLAAINKDLNEFAAASADATKNMNALLGVGSSPTAQKAVETTRKIKNDYAALADKLGNKTKRTRADTFGEDLAKQIALLNEEAAGLSKTTRQRERDLALEKVRQDAIKAGLKPEQIRAAVAQYAAAYDNLIRAKDQIKNDFGAGLKTAMDNFIENAKGAGDLAQEIFQKSADGISGIFRGLVDGSIKSFSDLKAGLAKILGDIAADIAEFVIKQQIAKAVAGSFGGGFLSSIGQALGFGGSISGTNASIATTIAANPAIFAKGGAFENGVQMFAKGGITNGITPFRMKSGLGVAGENGSEGILPLRRLSNGDLGVQSIGGGSSQYNISAPVVVKIDNMNANNGKIDPAELQNLGKAIQDSVQSTFYRLIDDQMRNGGRFAGLRTS